MENSSRQAFEDKVGVANTWCAEVKEKHAGLIATKTGCNSRRRKLRKL